MWYYQFNSESLGTYNGTLKHKRHSNTYIMTLTQNDPFRHKMTQTDTQYHAHATYTNKKTQTYTTKHDMIQIMQLHSHAKTQLQIYLN